MDVRAWLTGDLHFDAETDNGYRLQMNASPEYGGTGEGARPMALLLAGLAGCTGLDVIGMLKRSRQNITGLEVLVHGDRADTDPKVFTYLRIEYVIRGRNVSEDAVRRAIELSESKYCSVEAMFRPVARIESSYRIEQE